MNTDEKGMNTDGWDVTRSILNRPCSSVIIRVHHLQTYDLKRRFNSKTLSS